MDKYIVSVNITLEIDASMESAAILKAAKKFGKYTVNEIVVFNPDGTEAASITHDQDVKRYVRLKSPSK